MALELQEIIMHKTESSRSLQRFTGLNTCDLNVHTLFQFPLRNHWYYDPSNDVIVSTLSGYLLNRTNLTVFPCSIVDADCTTPDENGTAFPIYVSLPTATVRKQRKQHALDTQFLAEKYAFPQQSHSFWSLSTTVKTCTLTSATRLPIKSRCIGTLECNVWCSNPLSSLIILAFYKFPPVFERCIFMNT
jgi:hypothetical protein